MEAMKGILNSLLEKETGLRLRTRLTATRNLLR